MKAADAVILWTPKREDIRDVSGDTWGAAKVVLHPEEQSTRDFFCSTGANTMGWVEIEPASRLNLILLTFLSMTLRDGIVPLHAHEALCEIDEYRKASRSYARLPQRYENAPDDEEAS